MKDVHEETRLRYRYIDLRRPFMQERIRTKAAVNRALRSFLDAHGFLDIETPILTRATPEGARDYLVPSRTQAGSFFALPTVTATIQAAANGQWLRSILSNCSVLSR